jgi:hypothetical protein
MNDRQALEYLNNEFAKLTKDFDLNDWRICRSGKYWESDTMTNPVYKLQHKLKCIRHYINNDEPL